MILINTMNPFELVFGIMLDIDLFRSWISVKIAMATKNLFSKILWM